MSRYQHLPLHDAVFRYTKELYDLKKRLPKDLKHDLGQSLCESALRSLKLIVFANGSLRKEAPLRDLALEVETQWIFLRLVHDQRGMTVGQFRELGDRLTEISKQVTAWRKWSKDELKKNIR